MTPAELAQAEASSLEIIVRAGSDEAAGRIAAGVSLPRPAQGFGDSAIYAQRLLKWLGYYAASVDGLAGELTIRATRSFLRENELKMPAQITRELVDALEEERAARLAEAATEALQGDAGDSPDEAAARSAGNAS